MVEDERCGDEGPCSRIGYAYVPSIGSTGYDLIADRYDEIYEDRLGLAENAVVSRSLMREPPGAVLDLGCGNGAAARMMASRNYAPGRYVGTDLSVKMLANWHAKWPNGEITGQSMKWKHSGHATMRKNAYSIDLVHQSMDHPLPDSVFREFDLVTGLWSLSYLEPQTFYNTLRQVATYSAGSGSRLVMTLYTKQFAKTKYMFLNADSIKMFADESVAKTIEYETQWKILNCVGITGPVSRMMKGLAYPLTSAIDRMAVPAHKHTYILIEAALP